MLGSAGTNKGLYTDTRNLDIDATLVVVRKTQNKISNKSVSFAMTCMTRPCKLSDRQRTCGHGQVAAGFVVVVVLFP